MKAKKRSKGATSFLVTPSGYLKPEGFEARISAFSEPRQHEVKMNITNKATAANMELRVVNGLLEHGITCDYEPGGLQEILTATSTKYGWQIYLDSDRLRVRILMFRSGLRLDVACKRRFDRWANSRVEFHWTYDELFRRISKEDFEEFLWAAVDEFESLP